MQLEAEVLVVGAGCGGVAAGLAAAGLGRNVVLVAPSEWLGGQLTAQAVPPDEHPWVETTGITASYRRMRQGVRSRYRADRRITGRARGMPLLNPGGGWVSGLCAEPTLIQRVLTDMVAPHRRSGRLRILPNYRPTSADVGADRIGAGAFTPTAGDEPLTVTAAYVLDASEEGDLLPLAGCEYTLGAQSVADTGELHALDRPADPQDQQALTWCAALEWYPGADHTIDRPDSYPFWRDYRAPFWPGPQLGWTTQDPETGRPLRRPLFGDEHDLWRFRRIRDGSVYQPPLSDITLVNWPQVDYWLAPVVGATEHDRGQRLLAARELTRCFVYWMQTEAPRPDGGTGYPGLRLTGDPLGTRDGLAAEPYIRESRRIRAEYPVLEQHVGVQARPGASEAQQSSPTSPTAATGCIRSSGMSAKPPARWPRTRSNSGCRPAPSGLAPTSWPTSSGFSPL